MTHVTGNLRGTGSLAKKPAARGGKLPAHVIRSSAAAAKDYIRKGGEPPDKLVEEIAKKIEGTRAGKGLDPDKLRDAIRQGLAATAARDDAKDLTDAQLEEIADQGLNLALVYAQPGPGLKGM